MTLRNPTTVDGKTKRKSSGRKSDCQTLTPFFRPTCRQSAILREMAFQPMPLSRRALPFDHPEWRVAVAKETQYLDLTGHRGKTVPGLS
jgi:hypothetical protein